MKKKVFIPLSILILIAFSIKLILSDYEFGKYDSFEEAIEKGIPYKNKHIIHTVLHDKVTVVFYTTVPILDDSSPANYEVISVAFFEGSNQKGWENIGHNGWTHYENHNMTVYDENLYVSNDEGKTLHDFYVVFGEINNNLIEKVETKTEEEQEFKQANMITDQGKRYYYQFGKNHIVRGLSKDGEVIDRQGG
ncbi:hypothetical protein [Bacillus sp. OAE603]|uniref:hypothetical protein n=1 Tax=Gottfriedia sp. OAE603 TaxID=2663872 RepID=UPI0017898AC6